MVIDLEVYYDLNDRISTHVNAKRMEKIETLRNANFADMTLKAGHRSNKGHGRYNLEIFREDKIFVAEGLLLRIIPWHTICKQSRWRKPKKESCMRYNQVSRIRKRLKCLNYISFDLKTWRFWQRNWMANNPEWIPNPEWYLMWYLIVSDPRHDSDLRNYYHIHFIFCCYILF